MNKKIAFLIHGLSFYQNYKNKFDIDCRLSFSNYKHYLYNYFKNYNIDTFIVTNSLDKNMNNILVELYNPVMIKYMHNLSGNGFVNSNFKIKINIEQLYDYQKKHNFEYDYILIVRFDLYFNINFELGNIDYDKINFITQMHNVLYVCDNFYFLHKKHLIKLYNILKNNISIDRHTIKKFFTNNIINFIYNEHMKVAQLTFYKILRKLPNNIFISKNINNNNCIINLDKEYIKCEKINNIHSLFSWFGCNINSNRLLISFDFKINRKIDYSEINSIGFKTHNPDIIYSDFFINKQPNIIYSERLIIDNINNNLFIFTLDFSKKIIIEFYNLNIFKLDLK